MAPLDLVHNALAKDDLSKLISALSLVINAVDGSNLRVTRHEVNLMGRLPVRMTWLGRVRLDGFACSRQIPIGSNSIEASVATQLPALLEEPLEFAREVTLKWAGCSQKEELLARASALIEAMSAIGEFLERRGVSVASFLATEASSRSQVREVVPLDGALARRQQEGC